MYYLTPVCVVHALLPFFGLPRRGLPTALMLYFVLPTRSVDTSRVSVGDTRFARGLIHATSDPVGSTGTAIENCALVSVVSEARQEHEKHKLNLPSVTSVFLSLSFSISLSLYVCTMRSATIYGRASRALLCSALLLSQHAIVSANTWTTGRSSRSSSSKTSTLAVAAPGGRDRPVRNWKAIKG